MISLFFFGFFPQFAFARRLSRAYTLYIIYDICNSTLCSAVVAVPNVYTIVIIIIYISINNRARYNVYNIIWRVIVHRERFDCRRKKKVCVWEREKSILLYYNIMLNNKIIRAATRGSTNNAKRERFSFDWQTFCLYRYIYIT